MKALFTLAWKSLLNRRASFLLTLFAVALSVALFLGSTRPAPARAKALATRSPART